MIEPPTAILTARSILSIGAIRALRDLMTPPLTVIRQDVAALGEKAVNLLFAGLTGWGSPLSRSY